MKNVRRFGKFFACGLFTFLFIFTNISCEIGLGEAVDIDRPTVEITYPSKETVPVIRDSFVMAGNTTDDKGVNYIKVTARNASTGVTYEPKVIQMNGITNGQWQINLNLPLDANNKPVDDTDPTSVFDHWELPDAKYSFEVEAIDWQNKSSGSASITLEIDNTAPVFIASKPGAESAAEATKFGTTLKVNGAVAEDHDVSYLKLEVFEIDANNDKTTPVTSLKQTNVPTAGGINVVFADLNRSGTLQNNFNTICGSDDKNDVPFWAELEFSDNAKEYKNPSAGGATDTTGNVTRSFYLSDSLAKKDLTKNKNVNEIKEALTAVGTSDIKTELDGLKKENVFFSLNRISNPTFHIGSNAYTNTSNSVSPKANKGMTVTVTYEAGKDQVNIDPASVRLYLIGPIANYTEDIGKKVFNTSDWITSSKTPKSALNGKKDYNEYTYTVDADKTKFGTAAKIPVYELENKTNANFHLIASATSLNFDYEISPKEKDQVNVSPRPTSETAVDLSSGSIYLLVAVGEDVEDHSIVCKEDNFYGFTAETSGTAPRPEFLNKTDTDLTEPEKTDNKTNLGMSSYTNSKEFVYKGKTTITDGATLKEVTYKVQIIDKDGKKVQTGTTSDGAAGGPVFKGKVTNASTGTWEISYPKDPNDTSNYVKDLGGNVGWHGWDGLTTGNYTVEFLVNATDSGDRTSGWIYRSVTMDIENPVFSITEVVPAIEKNSKKYVNGNASFKFEASDNTNIESITYDLKVAGKTKISNESAGKGPAGKIDWDSTASGTEGEEALTLDVKVTDKAGNTKTFSNVLSGYYVDQNTDKPVITLASADDNVNDKKTISTSKKNLFTNSSDKAANIDVTVEDDDALKRVKAYYVDPENETLSESDAQCFYNSDNVADNTKVNGKVKANLSIPLSKNGKPFEKGYYKVRIVVEDKNYNSASDKFSKNQTKDFFIGITNELPTIHVTTTDEWVKAGSRNEEAEKANVSEVSGKTVIYIKGEVNSVAKTVTPTYKIGNGTATLAEKIYPASNKFTDKIIIASTEKDKPVVVTYYSTDDYGQDSATEDYTIKIDGTAPSFTKASIKWKTNTETDLSIYSKTDNVVVIDTTAIDGSNKDSVDSGVESIEYIVSTTKTDNPDNTLGTWKPITIGETKEVTVADGISYIYVRTIDKVGNVGYYDKFGSSQDKKYLEVKADTNKPRIDNLTIDKEHTYGEKVTITGTASDSAGLDKIEVYLNNTKSKTISCSGDKTREFTIDLDTTTIAALTEGRVDVKVTATDVGGNDPTEKTAKFVYDKTGPALTVASPSASEWLNKNSVDVMLNITDAAKAEIKYVFYKMAASAPEIPNATSDSNKLNRVTETWSGWEKGITGTGTGANKTWKIPLTGLAQGEGNKIWITAVDEYGNAEKPVSHVIKVDTASPTLSNTAFNNVVIGTETELIKNVKTFTLSGDFADTASKVTITAKRKDLNDPLTVTYTSAKTGKWSVSQSNLANGNYTYEITASDETGNSTTETVTITVDTETPAYTSLKVKSGENAEENYNTNGKWYSTSTLKLKGVWKDQYSGVKELKYWIKSDGTLTTEAALGTEDSTITSAIGADYATNYSWEFDQNFSFENGKKYLYVMPVDEAGNKGEIKCFKLYIDTEKPVLENVSKSTVYKQKGKDFTITGKLSDVHSGTRTTKPVVVTGKGEGSGGLAETEIASSTLNGDGTFTITVDGTKLKKSNGTYDSEYTITVTGYDNVNNHESTSFKLVIDGNGPKIETNNITKFYDQATRTVNGDVTIQGIITDTEDQVASRDISIYNADDVTVNGTTKAVTVKSGKTKLTLPAGTITDNNENDKANWNYKIDTTKLTNGSYVVALSAKDTAGNETVIGELLKVDQTTDTPVISPSNYNDAPTDANISAGTNRFDTAGNNKIMASIVDDDKLSSVKVEYSTTGIDGSWKIVKNAGKTNINNASYQLEAALVDENGDALLAGKYYLRITAVDTEGKTAGKVTDSFAISIDSTAPVFDSVKADTKEVDKNLYVPGDHTITITVSDDNGISKLEYLDGTIYKALTDSKGTNPKIYTHRISGKGTTFTGYKYKITDLYGRETEKQLEYNIDAADPTVDMTKVTVSSKQTAATSNLANTWFNEKSLTIVGANGVVKDLNLEKEVAVSVTGDSTDSYETEMTVTGATAAEKTGKFEYTRRIKEDGISKLTFTFKDKAERIKTGEISVKVDTNAPKLKTKAGAADYTVTGINSENYTSGDSLKVSFNAIDEFGGTNGESSANKANVSGLKVAYIGTKDAFTVDDAITTIDLTGKEAGVTDKSIDISGYTGNLKLYLLLVDGAGNKSEYTKIADFNIDRTKPEVTIDTVKDADNTTPETEINKILVLTGSVSEDNLPSGAKAKLYVVTKGATVAANAKAVEEKEIDPSTKAWSISYVTSTDGEKDFVVQVTDKSGLIGENRKTLTVKQDTDRPFVTFKNISTKNVITLNEGKITGSISDDDDTDSAVVSKLEFMLTYGSENTKVNFGTAESPNYWKEATVTGDSWEIDIGNTDRTYTLYTKVTDNKGTVFTNATAADTGLPEGTTIVNPKLLTAGVAEDPTTDPYIFSVDCTPPEIDSVKVALKAYTASTNTYAENYGTFETFVDNQIYGGKEKQYARLQIKAHDEITTDPKDLTVSVQLGEAAAVTLGESNYDATTKLYTYDIDFSDIKTVTNSSGTLDQQNDGTLIIFINVADKSGKPVTKTHFLTVDNVGPDIVENVSPSRTTTMTSLFDMSGTVRDNEGGIGVKKLSYCVPEFTGESGTTKPTKPTSDSIKWINSSTADNPTNLTFTGGVSFSIQFKGDYALNKNGTEIKDEYEGYLENDIYQIPVWFKIEDEYGNVGYNTDNTIKYDPNGDRPTLTVLNPVENESVRLYSGELKPYVVLGGTFSMQGIASDDEGISGIYAQYDYNGDGEFNDTDKKWLESKGYTVKTLEEWTKEALEITSEGTTGLPDARKKEWAIRVNGTTTWNTTFNTDELPAETEKCLEIGKTKDDGTPMNPDNDTMNVRICAVDADTSNGACVSGWDLIHVSVNRSIPQINLKLKRYGLDPITKALDNVVEEKPYSKDVYLTGKYWFLEGDVKDTDGINSIGYSNSTIFSGYAVDNGDIATGDANTTAASHATKVDIENNENAHNFTLKIPITTEENVNTLTRFTLTITAQDNNGDMNKRKTKSESYYINIDNTAPEFWKGETDGNGIPNEAEFSVYRDGYGGTDLNDENNLPENYLRNYNGPKMTIGSAAKETGSGFDKAVFYFKRTGKNVVYNVQKASTDNVTTASTANATSYANAEGEVNEENYGNLFFKDNLPVLKKEVSRDESNVYKLGLTGIGSNTNIHVGGLVYIGGSYRTISKVEADYVEISGDSVPLRYKDAYFVYASVVDTSGEDGSNPNENGDKDGLFESLTIRNEFAVWDATFNTANIPDGPIELHVVVFDKAGNVNHAFVSTRIWNNPPRLAKVAIGTDLNGDGNISADDDEIRDFEHTKSTTSNPNYYRADGKYYEQVWSIEYADVKAKVNNADWKIKNKLYVKPEFVGGNGDIYYKYTKEVGNGEGTKLTKAETASFTGVTAYTNNAVLGKLDPNDDTNGYIELINNVIDSTTGEYSGEGDVTPNTYQFSFWDSTDDLIPGSKTEGEASQWTVLNVELAQDLVDSIAPTVTITPFFWKGRGRAKEGEEPLNSIQWDGDAGEYTALGHIELESDAESWKTEEVTPTGGSKTTFGNDPKVSGKIVIRGSIYDETRLDTLIFSFDDLMAEQTYEYNNTNKTWEGTMSGDGWSITLNNTAASQDGHTVTWELNIDTAKLTGKAGLDKCVRVSAYDGTNWNDYDKTKEINVPKTYQMDVVPYVVEVITELSSLNANASIYNRTALGHYPVRGAARNAGTYKEKDENNNEVDLSIMNTTKGETITFKGFNLNVNDTASDNYEEVTKEVTPDMTSGEFVPSVNGIPAINNINNNNAKGAYESTITDDTGKNTDFDSEYDILTKWAYNRLPNNENNNLLNDDIYFDVWDINDRAAVPAQGKLEGVHMSIAPATSVYNNKNMIQFGAAFGNMMFGLGTTTEETPYSLASWNTRGTQNSDSIMVGGNGFHIDGNGNTWATNYNGEEIEVYAVVGSLFGNTDMKDHTRANSQIGLEKYQQDGNRMKTRFQSTSMASTTGDKLTNLYLAYYDALNDQIRFRAGGINGDTAGDGYGQLKNAYKSISSTTDAKYNTDIKNVQVIAGSSTALGAGPSIGKSRNAGNFVSIDVIKANSTGNSNGTDVVVAVWYDATNNQMMYSYTESPLDNSGAATGDNNTNGTINNPAGGWSDPETIFTGGGEYCQIKVDANGGIHMAAYANGNLEYAYKRSYTGTTVTTTVDSIFDTGTHVTLDVALVDSNPVPYIGYYAGSKPKYAYLNKTDGYTTSEGLSGVVSGSDLVNQNWEISVIPTTSTLCLSSAEKINVGVWKTDKGILNWSTKDGNEWNKKTAAAETNIGQTTWTQNGTSTKATVYGNGTKNGVVAYVVENKGTNSITCLETAQKR